MAAMRETAMDCPYCIGGRSAGRDCTVSGGSGKVLRMEPVPDEGVKYDETKPPLHLIAPDFLYAIADILDFGAKKYAPRNWEKGMAWHKVYRAAIGHLFDWWLGKGPDPETGKSHLWHAACCIMFLVCYEKWNVGTDDRPKEKAGQ
jgi:hypothetical protein